MKLDKNQLEFIRQQNLPISSFFDASGLSKESRIQKMQETETSFYFGGAACKASGHTLRTKMGHCIQCDTSKIAYQLRSSSKGYIYLAHSIKTNHVKIGYSSSLPTIRESNLKSMAYGKISDWEMIKYEFLNKNAGRTELSIHSKLDAYLVDVSFYRDGAMVKCREIFNCSLEKALQVFDEQKLLFH